MTTTAEDAIFKAIAHPTRRQIISLLAESHRSVKELTSDFAMSQPAISQHLRELKDARLVASRRIGLEQQYRLTAEPLQAVYDWSASYRQFFDPAGHAWRLTSAEHLEKAAKKKGGNDGR